MADYTNYTGAALFSIEQSIRKDWNLIWTSAHPFFNAIEHFGTNFNKNIPRSGTKMLIPLQTSDQTYPADGVTVANETSAMSYNTITGAFQAEAQYAHYRGNVVIRLSDKQILMSNEKRGNFMTFAKNQVLNSFKNSLSTDVVTATSAPTGTNSAAMTDALPSLRWILSNANVVFGKDQALDTNWQAVYNTGTGAFSTDYVDDDMDTVNAKGRAQIDVFLASNGSGGNVYSKFRGALAPGERYENNDFTRKSGIKSFMYSGAYVLMDNRLTAGELIGLSSKTWYVDIPMEPEVHPIQQIPGTDAYIQVYSLVAGIACDDIACNIRRTGIS